MRGAPPPPPPNPSHPAGWVSRSPSSNSSITVLEHRVAGDLFMPDPRQHPAAAGSPAKEGGGLRRRPVLRPSQQPAAASPSPKGAAAAPAAAAEKQASPSKKPEADDSDKVARGGASMRPRALPVCCRPYLACFEPLGPAHHLQYSHLHALATHVLSAAGRPRLSACAHTCPQCKHLRCPADGRHAAMLPVRLSSGRTAWNLAGRSRVARL